jgi:hypothetical protein
MQTNISGYEYDWKKVTFDTNHSDLSHYVSDCTVVMWSKYLNVKFILLVFYSSTFVTFRDFVDFKSYSECHMICVVH